MLGEDPDNQLGAFPSKFLDKKIKLFSGGIVLETIRQWIVLILYTTWTVIMIISIVTLFK